MARYANGWIKIDRRMVIEDIGDNVYALALWTMLLALANWKESKIMWEGKQRILPPGSVVFGFREFAERWECSPNTVKKWAQYLHETGRIVLEVCPRGILATICNWTIYQTREDEPRTTSAHSVHTDCTQAAHSVHLNEEGKKERKEEEKGKDPKFLLSSENIERAKAAWEAVLVHFKAGRASRESEIEKLSRWIQREGINALEMAFLGAKNESKGEGFNPADFIKLDRYLSAERFERFLNLGVQAWHRQRSQESA